jgi:hypothetical protein
MSEQTSTILSRPPPSHQDILNSIRDLRREVRSNGRKLDALLGHLGADYSSEDAAVLSGTEEVQDATQTVLDAKQDLPSPQTQQPTKGK